LPICAHDDGQLCRVRCELLEFGLHDAHRRTVRLLQKAALKIGTRRWQSSSLRVVAGSMPQILCPVGSVPQQKRKQKEHVATMCGQFDPKAGVVSIGVEHTRV